MAGRKRRNGELRLRYSPPKLRKSDGLAFYCKAEVTGGLFSFPLPVYNGGIANWPVMSTLTIVGCGTA